jgi:hypothetical protein
MVVKEFIKKLGKYKIRFWKMANGKMFSDISDFFYFKRNILARKILRKWWVF